MASIKLPSGISLQPCSLPSIPNVLSTAIDAAFCDDIDTAFHNYFEGLPETVLDTQWFARGMGCFSLCAPIYNWLYARRTDYVGKSWDTFMTAPRARFLKDNWHDTLRMEMTRRFMKESNNFVVWIEELIGMNNCLHNTTSHLDDKQFISITGANIYTPLYKTAQINGIYDTTKYPTIAEWQTEMNRLEEARLDERKCMIDVWRSLNPRNNPSSMNNTSHASGSQRSTSTSNHTSNHTSNNTSSSSFPATSSWRHPYYSTPPEGNSTAILATARSRYMEGSTNPAPPRLSPEEWRILDDNDGCTKCCRIDAGHNYNYCTNDMPSGDGYRPVAYKLDSYNQSRFQNNRTQPSSSAGRNAPLPPSSSTAPPTFDGSLKIELTITQ